MLYILWHLQRSRMWQLPLLSRVLIVVRIFCHQIGTARALFSTLWLLDCKKREPELHNCRGEKLTGASVGIRPQPADPVQSCKFPYCLEKYRINNFVIPQLIASFHVLLQGTSILGLLSSLKTIQVKKFWSFGIVPLTPRFVRRTWSISHHLLLTWSAVRLIVISVLWPPPIGKWPSG